MWYNIGTMETVILYDWADEQEGVVRTEQWGWCYSSTCNHVSHDPAFNYHVTVIEGEVLWRGIKGDYLVKSASGRVFLTRYYEGETEDAKRYRPEMWTIELRNMAEAIKVLDCLAADWHYRSPRHEALVALRKSIVCAFPFEGVEG